MSEQQTTQTKETETATPNAEQTTTQATPVEPTPVAKKSGWNTFAKWTGITLGAIGLVTVGIFAGKAVAGGSSEAASE